MFVMGMVLNSDIYQRRSLRLPSDDYAQMGLYFVTLCCHERQPLFGTIVDGLMMFSMEGVTASEE